MENFQEIIQQELEDLKKKLTMLEAENAKLKKVVIDNELEEEIEDIDCVSLEEQICINGIRHIASKVEAQDYDDKDIKNFDTLYRTIRSIRGHDSKKVPKAKVGNIKDLLKIAGQE